MSAPRKVVKRYIYRDSCGFYLFTKVRYAPKGFGYEGGKPRDADDYVYRLPELGVGIRAGRRIHWVEGEKDADALVAAGEVATTVHQGAGKVTPLQAEWFTKAGVLCCRPRQVRTRAS